MATDIFWKRSTNDTETRFCPDGGGGWSAARTLIAFLVTNILAHAATIRFPAGSNTASMVRRVIAAILLPVTAGDSAFHAIGRWLSWLTWSRAERHKEGKSQEKHLSLRRGLLRGDNLQDAAISGAVAVCIPFHLAPLLVGRWEIAGPSRKVIMLDDTSYFWGKPPTKEQLKPINPIAKFPRYVPFILPPDVEFDEELRNKTITPESNVLSNIIAVAQIILSVGQLYSNYGPSVRVEGLGSPYLVVIPYFLMSFVNFLANIFVASYRRVTMLTMKSQFQQKFNEIYIINCPREECHNRKMSEQHQMVLAIKDEKNQPESVPTSSVEPKDPGKAESKVEKPMTFEGLSIC